MSMYTQRLLQLPVILMIATVQIPAQQAGWERLRSVETDERVGVLLRDGKFVQGRFRGYTPSQIEITKGRNTLTFDAGEIRRITVQRKGSRAKAAAFGGLIGFGAAFPFGAASAGYLTDQNNPRLQTRAGMGAGFGLFGAGIGAAIGAIAGGTKNVNVYRAEKSR